MSWQDSALSAELPLAPSGWVITEHRKLDVGPSNRSKATPAFNPWVRICEVLWFILIILTGDTPRTARFQP